jgi:hypothetical protein
MPRRASVLKSASAISSEVPVVTVAPTIANHLEKGGGPADLARLVKAIRDLYIAFGEDMPSEYRSDQTMPLPIAIVNAVIDILSRTAKRARTARAKQAQKVRLLRDGIKKRKNCSLREASRQAAEELYPNATGVEFEKRWNTIYRSK